MIYPMIFNITDKNDNNTNYYVDSFCNVYIFDGFNLNPIHVHKRKMEDQLYV